jgi:N-acetylmuramoyl-L-alanine amidase
MRGAGENGAESWPAWHAQGGRSVVFPRLFGAIAIGAAAIMLPQGAPAETARVASRKASQPSCDRAQFRVVVDVGHSAEVPGATSARGVPEYEFNLRLANRIGKELAGAGFRQAQVLITPGAARRGLFLRVARAASVPADLFISIHHDSVPERFLETWAHDGKQLRYSDRFRGHSIFISYENSDAAASFQFAQLLGAQLKKRGLQYTPHYAQAFMQERRRELLDPEVGVYRFDQLIVLKDTRMPAVLLEAGSIIHRDEELLMSDPNHQARIGAAVTEAVDRYCAARSPQAPKNGSGRLREAQGAKPVIPATAAAPAVQ